MVNLKEQPLAPPSETVDVLVVTAVKDECDLVRQLESDWQERTDTSGFPYYVRKDPEGLSWALARATDMGPELAANVATRLVSMLKPRCLAMVGVCAGWREKLQLGDVVVAERLFRYDAGKLRAFRDGELRREEVFHDIRTYSIDPRWRQRAEDFPPEWATDDWVNPRPLGYAGQEVWLLTALAEAEAERGQSPRERSDRTSACPGWTSVVQRLEKRGLISLEGALHLTDAGKHAVREFNDRHPDGAPAERDRTKLHVAPMATGSRVVEDPDLFPTIHRYARKTLGVDMEAAAVAAVAEIEAVEYSLVVKGVQDYADHDKDDQFRAYAIEASYRFLVAFLRRELEPRQLTSTSGAPAEGATSRVPEHGTGSTNTSALGRGAGELAGIETNFARHTARTLRGINRSIVGLAEALDREEEANIASLLARHQPVVLVGEAGSGKSGIAGALVSTAVDEGIPTLFLDARRVADQPNEAALRTYLDLPVALEEAVAAVGRTKGCRLVVDQLDSTAGLRSSQMLVDLLVACASLDGVQVLAISRRSEAETVSELVKYGFEEVESRTLAGDDAKDVLTQLGVASESPVLHALAENLLNLDLIARIKQQNASFDFDSITDEVDLWLEYLGALRRHERVGRDDAEAEHVLAEAVRLAREALNRDDRTCVLDLPLAPQQRRLLSWDVLERQAGRVCRFRHEKLHDFLYAWGSCEQGALARAVLQEIPRHRTRTVLEWMNKLYQHTGSPMRVPFLREAFGV